MTDTMGKLPCPDCAAHITVAFVVVMVQRGMGKLISIAACEVCRRRGDRRSVRGTVSVDLSTLREAVANGLPALQIA